MFGFKEFSISPFDLSKSKMQVKIRLSFLPAAPANGSLIEAQFGIRIDKEVITFWQDVSTTGCRKSSLFHHWSTIFGSFISFRKQKKSH